MVNLAKVINELKKVEYSDWSPFNNDKFDGFSIIPILIDVTVFHEKSTGKYVLEVEDHENCDGSKERYHGKQVKSLYDHLAVQRFQKLDATKSEKPPLLERLLQDLDEKYKI